MKKRFVLFSVSVILLLILSVASVMAQSATPEETTWTAHYWNNVDFSGSPDLTRVETGINHRWGFGSPDPAINPDRFSARWTTSVYLEAGLYRFTTVSDDGVRVWVGGEQVIDNWTVHAEETDVATRSLDEGIYDIVVEYFENTGVATIFFSWEQLDQITDCGPSYVVQLGDWLSRIARQCGVSVERLLAANPHITTPNDIRVGQELAIPSPDVSATTLFNLNFRPVPTVNSIPMDVIPAGTTVPVSGHNLTANWLFVTYQDQQGWIAGWLTTIDGDLDDVPLILE
jgi:hypothetical protein